MQQAAFLVQNGIPLDTAMSFTEEQSLAWAVMFGRLKGGEWSWSTLSWVEKD